MTRPPYAAVVLSGGTARRMGGADKAGLRLRGRSLLRRALDAVAGADEIVVVGDVVRRPPAGVRFVREEPPYAGPAAALLTGVGHLTGRAATVLVLAVDMPLVTVDTVTRLLAAGASGASGSDDGAADGAADGAMLVDPSGRRQLALALRRERLTQAAPVADGWPGLAMRELLAPLELVPVPAVGDEARDVDTWADLSGLAPLIATLESGPVNLHEWIDELCDVLDVDAEVDEALVLDLARDAAHNVARPAAPVTTYLLGLAAGQQGAGPAEVEKLAAAAAALALRWDVPAGTRDPDDVDEVIPDDSSVDHSADSLDD